MNGSHRSVVHSNDVRVVRYEDQYGKDFARLNFEWIRTHFEVEEPDVRSLNDPFGSIIAEGGEIFFVLEAGVVRGTCALMNHGDNRFELAKMAVEPASRGKGYGCLLMESLIEFAREHGIKEIFLLSNTTLAPAINLYKRYGFQTVREGPHPEYKRANIEMKLSTPGV